MPETVAGQARGDTYSGFVRAQPGRAAPGGSRTREQAAVGVLGRQPVEDAQRSSTAVWLFTAIKYLLNTAVLITSVNTSVLAGHLGLPPSVAQPAPRC
jgi:hypothetical protein